MKIEYHINALAISKRLIAVFVVSLAPLPLIGGTAVFLFSKGTIGVASLAVWMTAGVVLVLAWGPWWMSRLALWFQSSSETMTEPDPSPQSDGADNDRALPRSMAGHHLFDVFMGHVPALAFIKDAQGRYIYINNACRELLKRSPEQMVGRTDRQLWPEEAACCLARNDEQILRGRQMLSGIERFVVGTEERCCLLTKFPIAGQDAPNMLGGFAFDITEKVRAEEDNARLEQQLIQSQKMEAIGTLAGGIAHDFNNVLAAIMGYAELALLDAKPGSDVVRHELEQVLSGTHRAKELVRQILTFSRRNDSDRQPLDPKPLVKEVLTLLRASIPSTIEIRSTLDVEGIRVLANATQFHQVLMNLCTNAAHAMEEEGGLLELRLQQVSLSGATARGMGVTAGRYLELRVSDTGHGISPDLKARIFDPYFTTKAQGKGTGMGLAVARGIVQSHRGSIDVESRLGEGSCFTVLLPVTSSVEHIPAKSMEVLPKGRESILFVDDEAVLVELGHQMLTRLGYRVTSVDRSLDALAMLEKDAYRFDLIITDTTMPHMTGDVLAERIKQIRPDLPVILCTGYSEQITPQKADSLGIAAFLMKPLTVSDLSHTLRSVLNDRGSDNQSGYLKVAPE